MKPASDNTAVVTGGGSGIGRSLAFAFARRGMNVAIGDVDLPNAEAVAAELRALGVGSFARRIDVTDRASMNDWATEIAGEFGNVHVLCNNAGVVSYNRAQEMPAADWDWVLGVNLHGVVNGLLAFLPTMVAHGEPGHVVNTSSRSGLVASGRHIGYTTTKFAVVGLSEELAFDLADTAIGVSVICPSGVRTRIGHAGRNRPAQFGGAAPVYEEVQAALDQATDPDHLAELTLLSIEEGRMHVIPHAHIRDDVDSRHRTLINNLEWGAEQISRLEN